LREVGWMVVTRETKSGRFYKEYHGPHGLRARSRVEALLLQQARDKLVAAGKAAGAEEMAELAVPVDALADVSGEESDGE